MPPDESASILVVDDEESVRRVISRMLSTHGYAVNTAANVDEALFLLKRESYDILLTDHMMEGRTGLDLIVETEALYPDMVKILLTGFGDRDLYREIINKSAVFSVLEKPSKSKQLLETIGRAVEYRNLLIRERAEIDKLRTQYHTLFAKTTDLIQCINIEGEFIYVNPAWHQTLGYNDEEVRTLSLFHLVHPDHLKACQRMIQSLRNGEQQGTFETIFQAKGGRIVQLEGSATIQSHDNEIMAITCILRDVTERKRTQEELNARLRQETMIAEIAKLLANTNEPINVYEEICSVIGKSVDAERAYLYAINDVERLFSKLALWTVDENKGHEKFPDSISFDEIPWFKTQIEQGSPTMIKSSNDLPETDRKLYEATEATTLLVLPVRISTCTVGALGIDTRKTAHIWTEHEINMLNAAADIIANAWTRQIEIDIRKQKEQEAEQSRVLVIRADRLAALGTMTAGIIHEITQPLNAINVSAQTILYGRERGWSLETEQVKKSLNLIVDQIKRMSEIVTNMRAFSRDGLPSPRKLDSLNAQVERVFTMIGEQMKAHDIDVVFEYGDIPEVSMNTHQILQVVLNLVTNARQALDDMNSDNKKIIIRTFMDNYTVKLEVSDNGPGISEEIREKIFDPFFTTKEVGKGTGLGLSISIGIIHDHQGDLTVSGNDMNGTTFTMSLPTGN